MMTRGYEWVWPGARRGQVMPVFALILVVLMGAATLGIDLSRVRAEAESAQRAANAAALAGVVYLPDFKDSAYTRASAEARKNGYLTGQKSVIVTPSTVPGYGGRLKVTINEPAPSIFGHALGIFPQTISRSATAEYDLPIQLGAPDYVLGYAPFPTAMVPPPTYQYQGFYLGQRGRYDLEELGDAYSPYFESFSGNNYGSASIAGNGGNRNNPCTTGAPLQCSGFKLNPDRVALNPTNPAGFSGYDYVVDDPFTNTLVIKLFDPYDERNFDANGGLAQGSSRPSNIALAGSPFQNKLIDEGGSDGRWGNYTTLEYTLSGPYQTPYDTSDKPITTTPSDVGIGQCQTVVNCVVSAQLDAGEDPAYLACRSQITTGSCAGYYSPYAFRFVNYAIIHGRGIFHIHVNSVTNSNGSQGADLNLFGLAVCADSNPGLGTASNPSSSDSTPSYSQDPTGDTTTGTISTTSNLSTNHYPYTTDPSNGNGSEYWNPSSCSSPNTQPEASGQCPTPGTAAPGNCVHLYAVGRMCIKIKLQGGQSLVPLGYVPAEYDGKTLQARLYDLGDTGAPPAGQYNTIQVLTPAGDQNYNTYGATMIHSGFPSNLDYTYEAAPTDNPGSGYVSLSPSPTTPGSGSHAIIVSCITACSSGSTTGRFNGSWLTVRTPINLPGGLHYSDMVNQFGGYWKILYSVANNTVSADTTTWEVSVNGAPVHLISGG